MVDLLHTTEEEQALLLNRWRNSPTISNIARRLIAEVKRLKAKGCPQCLHCRPDARYP